MINLMLQILAGGGLLLLKMVTRLVSPVLFLLLAGAILAICVGQGLFLLLVDKEYRSALFTSESDKQKLKGGGG